jgi:glutamate/tyrosine decarboxylase-like PLP-dependent enzyme
MAGTPSTEILADLESMLPDPVRTHWQRAFRATPDVQELSIAAYTMFHQDNGFFSLATGTIGEIEAQVLSMATSLFNPTADSCATSSSGGSESIFNALHAAREWARDTKPGARRPNIVVPYSAHPTFSKMPHYLGIEERRVQMSDDMRVDLSRVEAAIDDNTVALVGSAPSWWFSRFDPIPELGALAQKYDLWLHVDACVGGYLSPFFERLGEPIPVWDFRVPQVKSISADLHKYGYGAKPYSTVIWRSRELLKYHFVHPQVGPAGAYKMMGFTGSRPAGPIFAMWAIMRYLGYEGYLSLARSVRDNRNHMIDQINAIDGLYVPWRPELAQVPIAASDIPLEAVNGGLKAKGWGVFGMSNPPILHVPLDPAATGEPTELFLSDLREVAAAVKNGDVHLSEALRYG